MDTLFVSVKGTLSCLSGSGRENNLYAKVSLPQNMPHMLYWLGLTFLRLFVSCEEFL